MKISLIQPKIIRGNIEHNLNKIQRLIKKSVGDLLVLPEYALTGSLVLDSEADLCQWIEESNKAKKEIRIPEEKVLLLNSLIQKNKIIYNCCELLPTGIKQMKVHPDDTEKSKGIISGEKHEVIDLLNKKFKILICSDLKHWNRIDTKGLDFILWIYHFTQDNYKKRISELKTIIREKKIPILASSIISDKNIGFSTYIDENKIISMSEYEGILELEL